MSPYPIFTSCRLVSIPNTCLGCPLVSYSACKSRAPIRKITSLGTGHTYLSASIFLSLDRCKSLSYLLTKCHCKNPQDIRSNKVFVSSTGGKDKESYWGAGRGKRFSLRLRPRLRLLMRRLNVYSKLSFIRKMGNSYQKNFRKGMLPLLAAVAMGLCILLINLTSLPSPKVVPYSDFVTNLQSGSVSKVLFEEGSRHIFYNLLPDNADGSDSSEQSEAKTTLAFQATGVRKRSAPKWSYCTRKIANDESFLLSLMREKGTAYSSAPQSVAASLRNILLTVLTLWIPLTPLIWLLHRQLLASSSPAKKRRPSRQMVNFDDVEGVDSAKEELLEIVSCIQGSISYQKLGAKLPRGILLIGPPGTGKTLLARAVAGEAGVPFFSVSASEFVEMFVGRGAARIRDLFSVARKCEPSIIFIDELDAVGGKRGRSFNDERDQTLNQLLTEMDGFESGSKVIVIAATNRPEALDPALCRPGRFSRRVFVGEPDLDGRKKIMAVHIREVPLEEDPQLICDLVAALTPGFVGADLANIVNEAALLAARRGGNFVSREDILMAVERAKFGINGRPIIPDPISKGLSKLFPWMPSLARRGYGEDGFQGIMGYQTLS